MSSETNNESNLISSLRDEVSKLEAQNAALESELELSSSRSSYRSNQNEKPDEIDLFDLWIAVWKGKWFVLGFTFLFSFISLIYALNLPNTYKSSAILAPASYSSGSQLSRLAGQFGGLASIAGINLGSNGGENKAVIAIEVMNTWGFIEKFIEDNNIEPEVFAAKGWSKNHNKIVYDEDIYDSENDVWVREHDKSKGETAEPSSWELYEKFKSRFNISQNKETGLINISVEFYSPLVAKQWVDELIRAINEHTKNKDREEAARSISYLNEKIKEVNIADMQSVFYKLIEEQTKTLMLAEVSDEYVFKTLSQAKVPEEKSGPKRALICILGFLIGGLLSISVVILRYLIRR
ncbi:MAG: LPS O-antigen length regulator [Gammaproteobacteria bacterium]|nr:LPS O-antigen length regulator [Gammaproteobacteria bacterium]